MVKMKAWENNTQDFLIGSKVVMMGHIYSSLKYGKEYNVIDIDEKMNQLEIEGFGWCESKYFMLSKNNINNDKAIELRNEMFEIEEKFIKAKAKMNVYLELNEEAKNETIALKEKYLKAKEEYYDMIKEAQKAVIK